MSELTEVQFWEDYWRNCRLPSEPDMALSFDRCLADALRSRLAGVKGDVFEVGCAPGKWLAFMGKTFGMCASGIEYSKAGMEATVRNFRMLGLPVDAILTGDFFQVEPQARFDVVMSYGFIEHFDDPDAVVERHLRWLKPGGTLVLGVPNFNGVYRPIQRILDRSILDKHNLDIMNLEYFRRLAERFSLRLDYLDYIGSLEPSLPIAKRGYGNPAQFLVKCVLRAAVAIRRAPALDGFNNRYISSYILAVYRKGIAA
jgi:SAM-dependent methyltransferase